MQSAPLAWTLRPAMDVASPAIRNFQFRELLNDQLQQRMVEGYNFHVAALPQEQSLHIRSAKGQSCIPR